MIADPGVARNRFLTVLPGNPGIRTALRVVFADLASPFDTLNGMAMWVGEPEIVSEHGANVDPVGGFENFMAAPLVCEPHVRDWTGFGSISLYHAAIVPGSVYQVGAVTEACVELEIDLPASHTVVETSRFGDVVGDLASSPPGPPDGDVAIADVLAVIEGFSSVGGAPRKVRTDLEPATPDRVISISDVLVNLSAFSGLPFPFSLPADFAPCGQ